MKLIKRIQALFLAVVMGIGCFGTTAFATEIDDSNFTGSISDEAEIMPMSIDQTFTFTSYHRGADRTYSGNYLNYSIIITDTNGNPVDSIVDVCLYNYNHSYSLRTVSVTANGNVRGINNISISPGTVYYFTYTVTSGSTKNLKVRMVINDHN